MLSVLSCKSLRLCYSIRSDTFSLGVSVRAGYRWESLKWRGFSRTNRCKRFKSYKLEEIVECRGASRRGITGTM